MTEKGWLSLLCGIELFGAVVAILAAFLPKKKQPDWTKHDHDIRQAAKDYSSHMSSFIPTNHEQTK